MLKITDDNYSIYKKTFEIVWLFQATRLLNIDPNVDYSPVTVLNNWEEESKSIAMRGLREGLRDMVTMLLDLPDKLRQELNEVLVKNSLPGFYQLASIVKDVPKKVLKRGKIKTTAEYYIIKEYLDNLTSDIPIDERQQLERIFGDFGRR